MIYVGLSGWGDHDLGERHRDKLDAYAAHFPVVELDSSFYAVQPRRNYEKWAADTPASFSFVVKAYQGMTGHQRGELPFATVDEMYAAFKQSITPLLDAGKIRAILFQYPPWFDCTRDNVQVLREARERMGGLPVALEFRHQSWFAGEMRTKTLQFMRQEGWIHSICDEPQAGAGSVPTVLAPTDDELAIVRFHGRNTAGWNQSNDANWRQVRYLYHYSERELQEWSGWLLELQQHTKHIAVIFNNNSGGHAAGNAKQLMAMLGLDYEGLAPQQLNLF